MRYILHDVMKNTYTEIRPEVAKDMLIQEYGLRHLIDVVQILELRKTIPVKVGYILKKNL